MVSSSWVNTVLMERLLDEPFELGERDGPEASRVHGPFSTGRFRTAPIAIKTAISDALTPGASPK